MNIPVYYKIGKKEEARKILNQLIKKYQEKITFFHSQSEKQKAFYRMEIYREIEIYRSLLLLAQEKTKISIPNLVDESNPDKYHVMYTQLIPILVKAVQEMSSTITRLEAEINKLKIIK